MESVKVEAKVRTEFTKGARTKLRESGNVPAVFYIRGGETKSIEIREGDMIPLVFSPRMNIIDLDLGDGEERQCIIKDVQYDPVTDRIRHIDLYGLTKGQKLTLEIPVSFVGSPIGVKSGGVLQTPLPRLSIECLPRHIVEHIEVDVAKLDVGDAFLVSDLDYEHLEFLHPEDAAIASVVIPRQELPEEGEEGEEDEITEPELVGEEKDEESDEENDE
jgi:large subunit ribosomal protein L25